MNIPRARKLRYRSSFTEKLFWRRVRNRRLMGMKFRRQVPIGPFIADFVCFEKKLVIELDGPHHKEQKDYDRRRDLWFKREGYRVLRYQNHMYIDEDWVWEEIKEALK